MSVDSDLPCTHTVEITFAHVAEGREKLTCEALTARENSDDPRLSVEERPTNLVTERTSSLESRSIHRPDLPRTRSDQPLLESEKLYRLNSWRWSPDLQSLKHLITDKFCGEGL